MMFLAVDGGRRRLGDLSLNKTMVETLWNLRRLHAHSPKMELALNNNTLCIGFQHT